MSRNNTGNPIDSRAFPDFEDNVKNLDLAVNSDELRWSDRFGRDRKSFEGMEREFDSAQNSREVRFNDFISASGYQFLGDYAAGLEFTEYNQLVRDENGEFWRLSGQVELPYTTTGAGIPEGDALVPAGDAVLRQDLANPDKGALMVRGAVIYVDTIADLQELPVSHLIDGQEALVSGARFRWSSAHAEWQLNGVLPAEAMGAKGDDATDDTAAINNGLSQYGSVYLAPGKTYLITGALHVPAYGSLESSMGRAKVRTTSTTESAVVLDARAKLTNVNIEMATGHTSLETGAIEINLASLGAEGGDSRRFVRNVHILGAPFGVGTPSENGNGIVMSGSEGNASFCSFDNISMQRVNYGVYISTTPPAYVTANNFTNIAINTSVRAVHMESGDANRFVNLQWNQSAVSLETIYCNGTYNHFEGFFYDMNQGLIPLAVADFGVNAGQNIIRTTNVDLTSTDASVGKRNFIKEDSWELSKQANRLSELPYNWMPDSDSAKSLGFAPVEKPYMGHQDNILAFADKIHSVTVNGSTPTANERRVFNPFRENEFFESYTTELVYEITLASDNLPGRRMDFLQVAFSVGGIARRVKIEVQRESDGVWLTAVDVLDNDKLYVTARASTVGQLAGTGAPSAIRITLDDPAGASFRPRSIVGRYLVSAGNAFLPRNGGKIVGDLDFYQSNVGPTLVSPDGSRWRISVDNSGNISASSV